MKLNAFHNSVLEWCIVLFFACAASKSNSAEADVGLLASTARERYLVGEPIVLQVILTNTSRTAQEVFPQLGNGTGYAFYSFSKDRSRFEAVAPVFHRDPSGRAVVLNPNECLTHEEILLYDAKQDALAFPTGGRYYLRVGYRGKESNLVEVEIVRPSEDSAIRGLELIRSPDVLRQVYSRGLKDPGALKKLEELVAQPSPYSLYGAYFLASSLDTTNAIRLLQSTDAEGFQLRSRALLKRAQLHAKLGERETAAQLYDRVLREFPNSAAASELRIYPPPAP